MLSAHGLIEKFLFFYLFFYLTKQKNGADSYANRTKFIPFHHVLSQYLLFELSVNNPNKLLELLSLIDKGYLTKKD